MNREEFISGISSKMKLIRTEAGLNQDRMAEILGISKKTLVQVEKGRMEAGWPVAVTLCTLFRESEVLLNQCGGDPLELIKVLSFEFIEGPKERTLGGKLWWNQLAEEGDFRLQQNILSKHYRILDKDNFRWCSSFDENYIKSRLRELSVFKGGTKDE